MLTRPPLRRIPRAGGRSPFLHQVVRLGDDEIAAPCGLDQKLVPSVYDPGMRLLAELGVPHRAGEESPLTPGVLTGVPSADAERVWAALVAGGGDRPVVLLNPFGGSGITKGFNDQDALLAAEIAGLVDEGYLVVVLVVRKMMRQIASETGGNAFFPQGAKAIDGIYTKIVDELGARYTLGYAPADRISNKFRKLDVKLARPQKDVTVRARTGYYAAR